MARLRGLNPVIHRSDTAFHVVFQLGYQLYAVNEEPIEKVLADIDSIAHEFAVEKLHESSNFLWFAAIDISRSDYEIQDLAFVVADKVQLEAVKPAERTFAKLNYTLEYLVHTV